MTGTDAPSWGDGRLDPWSITTTELFERLRRRAASDSRTVIATVVAVEGSAYRRPGAKVAVTAEGDPLGAAAPDRSDPLAARARAVAESGRSLVETVDLTADDDAWGFGLGWNGVVTLLVEPLDAGWRAALSALGRGESLVLVTAVGGDHPDVEPGDRLVTDADGTIRPLGGADGEGAPDAADGDDGTPDRRFPSGTVDAVVDALGPSLRDAAGGESFVETVETDRGSLDLFVDGLTPAPELLVFGGRGDVRPVSRFARRVGFRVTVAVPSDGRQTAEAFPAADRVVAVAPADLAGVVDAPGRTYTVLMSHDFDADRRALASLVETPVPYVGLMGPRTRFEELQAVLAEEGGSLDDADRERLSTPVGLDLGGDEPAQVAMSVVAELLAVANGRSGGRLSTRDGPVHPRRQGVEGN